MSYILDALTRSQKQRERSAVPTLTTEYLTEESKHSTANSWQGIAIGLASAAVLMALYTMPNRPFTPDALDREPLAATTMLSVSPASASGPDAVIERAAHRSGAEPDTAGVALRHSTPHEDGAERERPAALAVRARQAVGLENPMPGRSATDAISEITRVRAQSSGRLPERRLSPESRWLVDEMLALRREAELDPPSGQAPSDAPQDVQAPANPVGGRGVGRHPEQHDSPPPVGAATGSARELPTLRGLPLETQAAIAPLEINVHTYAQSSDERMVLINMKRYAEGDRLREGPLIDAITPTGVVLIFNNQRFQLTAR